MQGATMKNHQLRALIQVADNGSIRGAARALNLSQSALTKALRELEDDVGAELLLRSYKGIEFTPAGAMLLQRARLALSILDKTKAEIGQQNEGQRIKISFAVTPIVAALELPQILREFRKLQPHAELSLSEGLLSNVIPGLIDGSLDFAVAIADPGDLPYDIAFDPLCKIKPVVAGRIGHPLANASTWDELKEAEWVLNVVPGSHSSHLLSWLQKQGFGELRDSVRCSSPLLWLELMRRTDRLGVGPARLFRDPISGHGLQCLDISPMPPSMSIGILTLRGLPLPRPAKQLLNLFERHLEFLNKLETQSPA